MDNQLVFDVSEATFRRDVIDRSYEVPVVVDFWAAWCGPCRALSPILERLASQADGRWVLAKVDVDSNQQLAAAFGVQGIPAVHAFKDGRRVAEFVGALPEPQVRDWLSELGPSEADLAYEDGVRKEARGEETAAAEAYRKALQLDPGHVDAKAALAKVDLRLRSGGIDEADLRARLHADPTDVDAAIALADTTAARGDLDAAFATLLASLRNNSDGDDRERARLHLLTLLDTVAVDDPRALAARRSLAAALF